MNQDKPKPPYGLKSIQIKNFRGIKDASLEDIPQGTPWIFLTGENGYGKTCLLQAIFIGLFGNTENNIILGEGDYEIELIAFGPRPLIISEGKQFTRSGKEIKDTASTVRINEIAAYGSSRLQVAKSSKSDSLSGSLFNHSSGLIDIREELKTWFYQSQTEKAKKDGWKNDITEKFKTVKNLLIKLIPNLENIEIDVKNDEVLFFEKKSNNQPSTFDELAAGYKNIIAMIGDMLIRLFNHYKGTNNPAKLQGIVIIDELDLHLHPSWQKALPTLLSEIFPKVQFIASTHSPIPFLGAPEGSVFIKVNRTAEKGITIEKLDIDISNWTPNLILSSKIFGFTSIFPVTHDENKGIRTEDTIEELKESDRLQKKLAQYLGKEKEEELRKLFKVNS